MLAEKQEKKSADAKKRPASESPVWQTAMQVLERLCSSGHEAYFAGGCIRDYLLGRPLHDVDIATGATPDQVLALFPRTVTVGKAFGVVRVLLGEYAYDVATFRSDSTYGDGRHPEQIEFADVRTDVLRRDFTVNGMMLDPISGQLLDYVEARKDLRNKMIRAIGSPVERFEEDHLRILRAVRFAGTLDFAIEPQTAAAIRACASLLTKVSAERVGEEIFRILTESVRAGEVVRLLSDLDVLRVVLPEVEAMRKTPQPPRFHPEGDVFTHTRLMLNALPPPPRDPSLAFAVLLHDVGKPATFMQQDPANPDSRRFPNHAAAGSERCVEILSRLKRASALVHDVAAITRRHMTFPDTPRMREARLRRFMGSPLFEKELELHRLDCLYSHGNLAILRFLKEKREKLKAEPVLPPPWVRGTDVIKMGLQQGPAVGKWLHEAYDAQLEGRFKNRRDMLAWLENEIQLKGFEEGKTS